MINIYKLIPDVYYDDSRDFQLFGRIYESLYNYLKTNVDLVKVSATVNNSDSTLLQLLLKTLGFDKKHEYDDRDIRSLCKVFAYILKDKGSRIAIENAIQVLLATQHISSKAAVEVDNIDRFNLRLWLPAELQTVEDVVLLEDLFDYILPSGYTYSITFVQYLDDILNGGKEGFVNSTFKVVDGLSYYAYTSAQVSRISKNNEKKIVDMTENEREATVGQNGTGLGTYYTGSVYKSGGASNE